MSIVTEAKYNQMSARTKRDFVKLPDGTYEEDQLLILKDDNGDEIEVRLSEVEDFDWVGKEDGYSIYNADSVDVITTSQDTYTYWFKAPDGIEEEDVTGDNIIAAVEAW